MTHLPHLSMLKIAAVILAVNAVTAVMDPTVKVALIVAVPSLITGVGTLALGFLTRRDNKEMRAKQDNMQEDQSRLQTSMDGHFTKILNERTAIGEKLTDKTDKLAHAEGRREGIEVAEDKAKEERQS